MYKFMFVWVCLFLSFASCKTTDSPQTETTVSVATPATPSTPATAANTTSNEIDKETQHKFDSFVKQGDHNYAEGNYREALNFYKKAQTIIPEQLGNDKLIACIKALQEPSTRRKDSK